ncbi:MAG: hydantoinase/oxoprolinase family protein, partial [Proteobacteria bacterium]|nr:hydantoinase/oxoprolinase family protein [Pseudomonadota bacterium]
EGVAIVLADVGTDIPAISDFLHGTTIAINTVLERKGANTALITTKGFRDVYTMGRNNRPEAFNLEFRRPRPLVPRSLTWEVSARMMASGDIVAPLIDAEIEAIGGELLAAGVSSVAVCLLHSYADPGHEQRIGKVLGRVCPGLFISLSHDILREYREYERTSTAALNAYVGPRVRTYLDRLEGFLTERDFGGSIQIMRSNGGTMSLGQARLQPVTMMESGPVAGMIAAGRIADILGIEQCIGFDMGGTTAKASLITDGAPEVREDYYIGGYSRGQPMQIPVVDIVEVGAGGGSIAWTDTRGGLHVGPESAGADPGPACYGKGGEAPVVTDADLVLARLNASRFLSGRMGLDPTLSAAAIKGKIADPLGLSVSDAALGIAKIADASMSLAVRTVSVERGCDPRDTTIIAFGGAGPLHAVAIAREIFIPRVIIPRYPGNFSALGMLLAPWRQDFVRTFVGDLARIDEAAARAAFDELRSVGNARLSEEGLSEADTEFQFAADLRYRGQEHTIAVPLGGVGDLIGGGSESLRQTFDRLHDRRYGHAAPDESIQIVNLRLILRAIGGDRSAEWLSAPYEAEDVQPDQTRDVIFDDPAAPVTSRIVWRPGLAPGAVIEGPAVIEEPNSTTLLYPGDVATVTDHGHLDIAIAGEA